ncbi:Uncharacterized protein K02A2.6, partial [Araneus ventricosus]
MNIQTIRQFESGRNPAEAWKFWKQDFADFLEAAGYAKQTEKTKTAVFRHVCGDELKAQYRSLDIKPKEGEIFDSFVFLEIKQKPHEKFQEFYTRLKLAAEDCNYDKPERMLRDKIVQGINDKPLQERLLRETSRKPKSLQEIVSECKSAELSKDQSKAMNVLDRQREVNAVKKERRSAEKETPKFRSFNGQNQIYLCKKCNLSHSYGRCPAYGTTCKNCALKNHWEITCRNKKKQQSILIKGNVCVCACVCVCLRCPDESIALTAMTFGTQNTERRKVSSLEEENLLSTASPVCLAINNRSESQSETNGSTWFQELSVNGNLVNFKLDTGAQVNVLPFEILHNWENIPRIKTNSRPILDYSNNQVPIIGELILTVKNTNSSSKCKFLITSLKSSPILGLNSCLKLKLIKRIYQLEGKCLEKQNNCVSNESIQVQNDNYVKVCNVDNSIVDETPVSIINEFHDVFSGIGKLNKVVKIHLKDNYAPSVAAARKIPLALHDKVKAELNRMENMGVITKVEQPTEWVSNIVVIDNPNKLRICIDPRPLNEAIKIPHYPIPSADRLMTNLQGSTVFSLFDATNGFWQLALDEESSYLTTFATPWGRYRFLVLPFGLNNSPEEFQKAMEELFENEPNVIPYFDDICIGSKRMEEHCKTLRIVLNIARKSNLKFNPVKTQLAKSSITYLGHKISGKGIEPDSKKLESIEKFP